MYHIPKTEIHLNFPPPFLPLEDAVQSETHDIFHSNTHYLLFSALDTHKTNDLTAKAKSTRCWVQRPGTLVFAHSSRFIWPQWSRKGESVVHITAHLVNFTLRIETPYLQCILSLLTNGVSPKSLCCYDKEANSFWTQVTHHCTDCHP